MIKYLFCGLVLLFCLYQTNNAEYLIKCDIRNYNNIPQAYLYKYYYGKYKLVDTAKVSDGSFSFLFDSTFSVGIYKIRLSPSVTIENILFNNENIEITADYEKITSSLNYNLSQENILLKDYFDFINMESNRERAINYLMGFYNQDDLFYQNLEIELKRLKEVNRNYIKDILERNKGLLASKYIYYDQLPFDSSLYEIDGNTKPNFENLINHYWDNINFSDSLLLYLPILEEKIDNYFNLFENPSLSRDEQENIFQIPANIILEKSAINVDINRFIIDKILNDAGDFGLMNLYQFIAEKYTGGGFCDNDSIRMAIQSEIVKTEKLANGNIAPDFNINDKLKLSGINKEFVVIIFWESTCPHCSKILNELHELYPKMKNLEIIAINLDKNYLTFQKRVTEKKYKWLNVYAKDSWNSEIVNMFNIRKVPYMFLLDKYKKIISKPVTTWQIRNKIEQ